MPLFLLLLLLFSVRPAFAQLGVGIRYGKMRIQQILIPGSTYTLPLFPVINTGSKESNYQMSAESWPEKGFSKPEGLWFYFQPRLFKLKPAEAKEVSVHLRIPMYADSGQYAALIKANAVETAPSNVFVGPAVGAKVYFEVGRAPSILGAYQARIGQFWRLHFRILILILLGIDLVLLLLVLAYLITANFEIRIRKRDKRKGKKMIK